MRKTTIRLATLAALAVTTAGPLHAQELTGDESLACQAMLCLSSATRPTQCVASLTRYFSISFPMLVETIKGRLNFLHLCPVTNTDPNMGGLADAISQGAGRCDADSLNAEFFRPRTLPSYCAAFYNNPYVDLSALAPVYVPGTGRIGQWDTVGHWVAPTLPAAPGP